MFLLRIVVHCVFVVVKLSICLSFDISGRLSVLTVSLIVLSNHGLLPPNVQSERYDNQYSLIPIFLSTLNLSFLKHAYLHCCCMALSAGYRCEVTWLLSQRSIRPEFAVYWVCRGGGSKAVHKFSIGR